MPVPGGTCFVWDSVVICDILGGAPSGAVVVIGGAGVGEGVDGGVGTVIGRGRYV